MLPLSVFQVEAFCAAAEPTQSSSTSSSDDDPRTEQPWLPLPIGRPPRVAEPAAPPRTAGSSSKLTSNPELGRTGRQELLRRRRRKEAMRVRRQQLDLKTERD